MAITHAAGFSCVHQRTPSLSRADQPKCRPSASFFPFLSLPVEIRHQIYRELLVSDAEWIRPVAPWVARTMARFPKAYMIRPWPHPRNAPDADEHTFESTVMDTSLFRACKQVYHEALPVLLGENPVVISVGVDESAEAAERIERVLRYARVLAVKVESMEFDTLDGAEGVLRWARTLQRRTNLRTLRIRFMDREERLLRAWRLGQREQLDRIKDELTQIQVCAVATVEHNLNGWLRTHAALSDSDEVSERKVEAFKAWLQSELAGKMQRDGCQCPKREDGRHAGRVEIGKGSQEAIKNDAKFHDCLQEFLKNMAPLLG